MNKIFLFNIIIILVATVYSAWIMNPLYGFIDLLINIFIYSVVSSKEINIYLKTKFHNGENHA